MIRFFLFIHVSFHTNTFLFNILQALGIRHLFSEPPFGGFGSDFCGMDINKGAEDRAQLVRLLCVAVCCSVLQCVACVAVWCSVLQFCGMDIDNGAEDQAHFVRLLSVAVCCSVLQRVAACCSVLQCVGGVCSVLQL